MNVSRPKFFSPIVVYTASYDDIFSRAELWSVYIVSPFIFLLSVIGNSCMLAFHVSKRKNMNVSQILFIIYSLTNIISCLFLICFIPIFRSLTGVVHYNILKKQVLWIEFTGFVKFFLCSTMFCVTFTPALLFVVAYERFINVYMPINRDNKFIKFSSIFLCSIFFIFSLITGIEFRNNCTGYCFVTYAMASVFISSVVSQVIFYVLIGVKLIKKRKNFIHVESTTNDGKSTKEHTDINVLSQNTSKNETNVTGNTILIFKKFLILYSYLKF